MNEQVAINALISGSAVVLAGVSFYIPYSIARFFHFTHGAAYTVAAYVAFLLAEKWGFGLWTAAGAAVLASCVLGFVLDRLLYRKMRRRGAGAFVMLLASLGSYVLAQNLLSLFFGDAAVSISATRQWGGYRLLDGRITKAQALQFAVALAILFVLWLTLKRTKTGLSMQAVGQDANLARCVGIPTDRIIALGFTIGYGLAGLAGVVMALNVDVVPTMGMRPMMLGMVAMIVGGNTLTGTVCGALLIGIASHLGVVWLPTQWQDAIAFVILILFLLIRPQGFVGKPVKTVTV